MVEWYEGPIEERQLAFSSVGAYLRSPPLPAVTTVYLLRCRNSCLAMTVCKFGVSATVRDDHIVAKQVGNDIHVVHRFCGVAQHLSVTKAGNSMHVSQSSLSNT